MQEEKDERQAGIQVIARAGQILRALGRYPQGLSLAAIAQEVELPRSTVQRITKALADERLVEPAGVAGGLRLGPALAQLVVQSRADIVSVTQPYLEKLSEQLHESVSLSSLSGDKVYVINRVVAERELRVMFPVGVHVPVHATSSGKVLLSVMEPSAVQELLPKTLPALTEQTLTRAELLRQLAQIKEQQLAFDADEIVLGVSSYSVTLDTCLGLYALSVVAPGVRMQAAQTKVIAALQASKQSIEAAIGRS